MALKRRAPRPPAHLYLNDSSCAPAHNTRLPLKRSPPASFKRLLGGVPFTIAAAISLRKGIPQPLPDTPSRLLTQPTPTARYPRVPPGCATLSPFDAPGHGA